MNRRGRVRGRCRGGGLSGQGSAAQQLRIMERKTSSPSIDMQEEILNFMKLQTRPVKTLELARAIGLRNKKEINPIISELEKRHLLIKNSPGTWTVNPEVHEEVLSIPDAEAAGERMQVEEKNGGNDEDDVASMSSETAGDVEGLPCDTDSKMQEAINTDPVEDNSEMNDDGYVDLIQKSRNNQANNPSSMDGFEDGKLKPGGQDSFLNRDFKEDIPDVMTHVSEWGTLIKTEQEWDDDSSSVLKGESWRNSVRSKESWSEDTKHRILHLLQDGPLKTIDMARKLGFVTKKEINPVLYDMQKKGLVIRVQDVPPVWKISNTGSNAVKNFGKNVGLNQDRSLFPRAGGGGIPMSPKAFLQQQGMQSTINNLKVGNTGKELQINRIPPLMEHAPTKVPPSLMSLNFEGSSSTASESLLKRPYSSMDTTNIVNNPNQSFEGSGNHRSLPMPGISQLQVSSFTGKVNTDPSPFSKPEQQGSFLQHVIPSPPGQANAATTSRISLTPATAFKLPPTPMELLRMEHGESGPKSAPSSLQSIARGPVIPGGHSYSPPSQHISGMNANPVILPQSGPSSFPGTTQNFGNSTSTLSTLNSETFAALNKNPVSALLEYAQSRKMTATIDVIGQSGPSHNPRFRIAAVVGKRQFPPVESRNKKDGKKDAADKALRMLIAEGAYQPSANKNNLVGNISKLGIKATHFDRIACVAHQKFNILAAMVPETLAGRKILAALVMKHSPEDEGIVVSLGTGNRCVTGEMLSLEGKCVNDSHAEIITRRGFMRFLYKNLLSHQPGTLDSLFTTPAPGQQKLKLKNNITFHLYISTAPCGDGALFSPRDKSNQPVSVNENDETHNPTFTSAVQGVLRTKMEGGEGTIPIEPDFETQTLDGILRGERLRTMSCSDKICRWNIVGMQGALLSHFVEPIYLRSLTLGYLYDHGHLSRAVCCRLDRGDPSLREGLPAGFHVNHPHLGRVTAYDPSRETEKTKQYSINWCHGDAKPEATDGTKGALLNSVPAGETVSQVSKLHLYRMFRQVCNQYRRQDLLQATSYCHAKQAAADFQKAKTTMCLIFKRNKFGPWVKKPIEEEMFHGT